MKQNLKRRIALGAGVLTIAALGAGMVVSPASAHDRGGKDAGTGNNAPQQGDKHQGGKGGHGKADKGGKGNGRGHNDKKFNAYGTPLHSVSTAVATDGSSVSMFAQNGSITAVDATSITVTSADGYVATYTPDANSTFERNNAAATLADCVVGDSVRVNGSGTTMHVDASDGTVEFGAGRMGHRLMPAKGAELVSETTVFQQADGSYITVVEQTGVVTVNDGTTLSFTAADNSSVSVTLDSATTFERDRATAAAADVAVGDHVRVLSTTSGDITTVVAVRAVSSADWTAMETARAEQEAAEAAANTADTQANTLSMAGKKSAAKQAKAKAAKLHKRANDAQNKLNRLVMP